MNHAELMCSSIEEFVGNRVKTHQDAARYVLLPDDGCSSSTVLSRYAAGSLAATLLESLSVSNSVATMIAMQVEVAFGVHWLRYNLPWDPAGNIRTRLSMKYRLLDTASLGNELQALQIETILNMSTEDYSPDVILKLVGKLNQIYLGLASKRSGASSSPIQDPIHELLCLPEFYLVEIVKQVSDVTSGFLKHLIQQITDLRQTRVLLRAIDSLRSANSSAYDVAPIDLFILSSVYREVSSIETALFGTQVWNTALETIRDKGFDPESLTVAREIVMQLEEAINTRIASTLQTTSTPILASRIDQLLSDV